MPQCSNDVAMTLRILAGRCSDLRFVESALLAENALEYVPFALLLGRRHMARLGVVLLMAVLDGRIALALRALTPVRY